MIIQIIGLPGSGKTELAKALKERINAISATQKRKEMGI
jgi:dephospho-CoA kinase